MRATTIQAETDLVHELQTPRIAGTRRERVFGAFRFCKYEYNLLVFPWVARECEAPPWSRSTARHGRLNE